MNTKLTLTLEQTVIERAKKYAKQKDQSLSKVIENYLKAITTPNHADQALHTPIVQSLKGVFKAPKDFDYGKQLADRLSDKYL